jgi:hypothetical protein
MGEAGMGIRDRLLAGASISADGRYVAFRSEATNLVGGDTNGASRHLPRGPL